MIVGTAGHIDHGKTSLVAALTGVDTDRLPEEKRRGISIELGYAYLARDDGPVLGFIDVPGHEKLVHTMLAGATGIDHALLVVAADDGVMPQTREHLAILSLLGVSSGLVAITKCDRVEAVRVAEVEAEVRALLEGSPLEGAALHRVSAVAHTGIAGLRAALLALASDRMRAADGADQGRGFRLAVDRAFTLAGIGTIVTGSVHAGRIAVGDAVQLARTGQVLRVRSLHAQNRDANVGEAHQRCALNLAGIGREELRRGDWITAEGCAATTSRLDAAIRLWRDEEAPLATGATVHLHLGAAQTLARIAVLDAGRVVPGASASVQLVLEQPIGAWQHDRIVLRDASATRTIGGGVVLDPGAPVRYRRTPERLALLGALSCPDPAERLARALVAAPTGIDAARWQRDSGTDAASALPPSAVVLGSGDARWLLDRTHHRRLREALLDALLDHHARAPDELGLDAARLRRVAAPRAPEALVARVIEQLLLDGALVRRGAWLHRPEHEVRLSDTDRRITERALPLLHDGRFDPPWVRDLARDLRDSEAAVRQALARLARQGVVFQVVRDLYYPAAAIDELARIARDVACDDGEIRAARFRDRTGLGRKRAIQVLEFFDRVGFSRRVRDQHLIRPGTTLFAAPSAPGPASQST